jgi:hypothetical protein
VSEPENYQGDQMSGWEFLLVGLAWVFVVLVVNELMKPQRPANFVAFTVSFTSLLVFCLWLSNVHQG